MSLLSVYPKEFYGTTRITSNIGQCFVLMPFADPFLQTYNTIKKVAEDNHMSCERADDITSGGHIILSILEKIAESEFIIVDLTDKNPNVFYELGITHMVKDYNKVILISQNMDFVPFDLGQFRCIIYEPTHEGYLRLGSQLSSALVRKFVIRDGERFLIPIKIAGKKERYLHELEIYLSGVGSQFVKCELKIYRIERDRSRNIVFEDWYGLESGESFKRGRDLPVRCDLRLENVSGNSATFTLDLD